MTIMTSCLDLADALACRMGLAKTASWQAVARKRPLNLYAGKLRRGLPQFMTHFGITPFFPSSRNIPHDIRAPMPLPDKSVDLYQSEDVFEHVPYEHLPQIFDDIFRILKPGALFRLSLPDYGSEIYRRRAVFDQQGNILFDPGGGGRLENGEVVEGGHVWFPTYSNVRALFEQSRFSTEGAVKFLHATRDDETFLLEPIDYTLGYIQRTPDNDARASNPRRPLSIVVDAWKNA
jgi:SAM-dependent methyltransferase